jgi:hypothetical protein
MTKAEKLSEVHLRQFTGSENWYRHGINRNVLFTDGAKYVADEGGAYWLLDAIANLPALREARGIRRLPSLEAQGQRGSHRYSHLR